MTGAVAGTANSLRLWVDASSRASRLVLGLYSDASNNPGTLLGSGSVERPVAGAWNTAFLPSGVPIVPGRWYWLSVLNPPTRRARWPGATAPAPPGSGQSRGPDRVPGDLGGRAGELARRRARVRRRVAGRRTGGRADPDAHRTPTPTGTPTETATPTPTPTATAGPCRSDSCDFEFEPVPQPAMTPHADAGRGGQRAHRHGTEARRRVEQDAEPRGDAFAARPGRARPPHADGARARHARRHDRAARLRLQAHDARRPGGQEHARDSRCHATAGRMSP